MVNMIKKKKAASGEAVWGLLAEFEDITAVYHAAQKCRDAGFTRWDVYAPVPIHGMDEAMGLKPSRVPFVVGVMAALGISGALALQWWTIAVDYPIPNGGKPLFAWEAALPITFELGVLLSAFGALFGMLILNALPMHYHPLLKKERFLRVSDDRFCIAVEARDPKFDLNGTRGFLESLGGRNIDVVEA